MKIYQQLRAKVVSLIAFLTVLCASAQTVGTVTGTVTDQTGEPLIGATVKVSGGKVATVTDLDGKYSIPVASDGKLIFTYIGYSTLSESVNGRDHIDVVMHENAEQLDQLVVIGYSTQKKADR